MEPTKYSSKVIDTIVYALVSINLLISCVTYLHLSDQAEAYNEQITKVIDANAAKIVEITIESAEQKVKVDELSTKVDDLSIENATLRGEVERMKRSYPFTTVYDLARIACQGYDDIEPELVLAVARIESSFDPSAISSDGSTLGLMQINPRWHGERAKRLGVSDFNDPYGSILLGTDYLHEIHQDLIAQTGIDDWNYVLMIYNMKRDTANSLYSQGIISDYAKTVMNYRDEYKYLFSLLGNI